MAAATREYDTPLSHIDYPISLKQKGAVKIWNGTMVCVDANGWAIPAADTAGISSVMGRAQATVDSAGLADGVASVEASVGLYEYDNPAGANQLTQVDVGKLAFVLTDHEVIRTGGTVNARVAGRVVSVDVARAKATIDHRQKTA